VLPSVQWTRTSQWCGGPVCPETIAKERRVNGVMIVRWFEGSRPMPPITCILDEVLCPFSFRFFNFFLTFCVQVEFLSFGLAHAD
jgi:hypothetical protein